MVSNYSDAGQQRWLAGRAIDLLRGTGAWPASACAGERLWAIGDVNGGPST